MILLPLWIPCALLFTMAWCGAILSGTSPKEAWLEDKILVADDFWWPTNY